MPDSSRRTSLRRLSLILLVGAGLFLLLRHRGPSSGVVSVQTAAGGILSGIPASTPAAAKALSGLVSTPLPAPVATPEPASTPLTGPAPLAGPPLFSYVQPANAAELDATLHSPTRNSHYVKLDQDLITGKQSPFWQKSGEGHLTLPLPDGGALAVVIHDSEMLGAQRFTSTGTIEGRPESRAIFAYDEGFLHASIEDVELGSYALRAATGEVEQFYQVDPALVPSCGGEVHPVPDSDAFAELAKRLQAGPGRAALDAAGGATETSAPSADAAPAGANVVVHVMMLYTQGVLTSVPLAQRPAAAQSQFDTEITQVNSDLARSQVSARVKLVKVAVVNYPGDDTNPDGNAGTVNWQSNMLDAVRKTTDGLMDEIHPLRDQVGADLVCLIQHRTDSSSAGIGYILDTPGDNFNSLFAFSVVGDAYFAQHVVSHELGHNFGCAHNREDSNGPGVFSYSYGYRFTGTNGVKYRDIMSYDTPPGTYIRLPYFSTPNVVPVNSANVSLGVPIGIAAGLPGEADNARTIDQEAFEVAGYRLQTQSDATVGTLVNVSTRAFVGTGEQQLIAGFIISGTQPKKVLIRVAGPALATLGVSGVVPDPKVTLNRVDVSPSVTIAKNDTGWGTQTGTSSGVSAADIVNAVPGAFAFASGSKDAALLVTLAPGNYTANVESVSGVTGSALVEVYEVGSSGSKLFNLSTRGYVAKGAEMFGGFIVQGDAGTTKRILIRTRGPSLAQFGITNPLNDPYMELYNSTSTLLMTNDDWSTSSGTTNGISDDAKPTATIYSEQQIFATGFAPGNRRESCLMVDLPPGGYSVIVKPFEDLTSIPPQPALPGVAVIEVFEINK